MIGLRPASAAPTATPVMAFSAVGMSNTRAEPKASSKPLVVPKIAPGSVTPSPKQITLGSASIA